MNNPLLYEPRILLGLNNIIDSLLPGCLEYSLTKYTAQSVERTNTMYDSCAYATQDYSSAAQ